MRRRSPGNHRSLTSTAKVKPKFSLTILILGTAAATLVIEHRVHTKLCAEIQTLRQQVATLRANNVGLSNRLARIQTVRAPRLPTPHVQFTTTPTEPANTSQSTNLFDGLPGLKAKAPNKLSAEQLESYFKARGRDAASLLAAYRTTGDAVLLQEAMQRFHDNPQVALEAALRKDASPTERRQWLETFKQSDPGNALPNYLLTLDFFKTGQADQAVQELVTAAGKPQFNDYLQGRAQENEQVYLAAGYPPAEAKAISPVEQALYFAARDVDAVDAIFPLFQQQTAQHGQTKGLCQNLVELANSYRQGGDPASAQAALQMAADLAQHYNNSAGEDGLSRLVGGAAEVLALSQMDPNSPYGNQGQTVQDRISQLRQQRAAIKGLYQQAAPLLGAMSDQDWETYSDRARVFGEPAALQWVVGKYGQK